MKDIINFQASWLSWAPNGDGEAVPAASQPLFPVTGVLAPCKGWVSWGEIAPEESRAGPCGCSSRIWSPGMRSGIPLGFALLCNCGDAVLRKFCTASAEADDKEFGPARLKTNIKKGKKKPHNNTHHNSKSTVCVPSDCIFMPTWSLCINVFAAPGEEPLVAATGCAAERVWVIRRPCWITPRTRYHTSPPCPCLPICGSMNANSTRQRRSGGDMEQRETFKSHQVCLPGWDWAVSRM